MTVYFEYLVQLSTYGKISHYYVDISKFLKNYLLPITEFNKASTRARMQTGCAGGRPSSEAMPQCHDAALSQSYLKFSSFNTELTYFIESLNSG